MDLELGIDDSIIACSSGKVNAAISLIRISTSKEFNFFNCFSNVTYPIVPRKSYLTDLFIESSLDEVLVTFFPAPHSFTGENVIEISVHGNSFNVDKIINKFNQYFKTRDAKPGEFSFRALKNNKLSLSQVEGLDLLLNSKSNDIFESGLKLLKGDLHDDLLNLKKSFIGLKAALEFNIDFSEDMGEEESKVYFNKKLLEFDSKLSLLSSRVSFNNNVISPKVVIFGEANSGKSTLFNQILGTSRSIVSDIEGTTRDYISEELRLDSGVFTFVDTAGIRETIDEIEKIGINSSFDQLDKGFFKILLINSKSLSIPLNNDLSHFDLIIFTHYDFGPMGAESISAPMGASGSIGAEYFFGPMGAINEFKAKSFLGPMGAKISIDQSICFIDLVHSNCRNDLFNLINIKYKSIFENNPILVPRYKSLIHEISKRFEDLKLVSTEMYDIAIMDNYLIEISRYIDEIVGILPPEELLNHIFDNFCIGK